MNRNAPWSLSQTPESSYEDDWTVDSLHAALNGKATPTQARFIAASPAMCKALEKMFIAFETYGHTDEQSNALAAASAALAKARSQS